MASWSETTKHEPSSINGGQRYAKGDRVSREQLNLITENSFYAVNKSDVANANSENALAVANNAFEQSKVTGTQVTVGGEFQPTFDADTKADKSELLDKIHQDKNGILKIGDVIIPQKKLLYYSENGAVSVPLTEELVGKKLEFCIKSINNTPDPAITKYFYWNTKINAMHSLETITYDIPYIITSDFAFYISINIEFRTKEIKVEIKMLDYSDNSINYQSALSIVSIHEIIE